MVRVILISSVLPSPSSAGQAILHRHLVGRPEIDLQVFSTLPGKWTLSKLALRILGYLRRTKLHVFSHDIISLWKGRWIDAALPAPEDCDTPVVVMTVAHGDTCYAAMRYAKKHGLPLVTFFHDWWPDMAGTHKCMMSVLDRDFRHLYRASDLALCVGPGMQEQLGDHPNALVLYPIPSTHVSNRKSDKANNFPKSKFRLLYAGNFGEYTSMIRGALDLLKDDPAIRLEVRGPEPDWPAEFTSEMRERGLLLPFADRGEFEEWLNSADAYLIPMSFEPKNKRRMETSYLSKIPEYSRLGRPLVVWSPSYGSAYRWAAEMKSNIVVNEASPDSLQKAIYECIEDPDKTVALKSAASHDLPDEFEPSEIQAQFLENLKHLVRLES